MEIFCPKDYSGTLMDLAQTRRGEYVDMKFLTEKRVSLKCGRRGTSSNAYHPHSTPTTPLPLPL